MSFQTTEPHTVLAEITFLDEGSGNTAAAPGRESNRAVRKFKKCTVSARITKKRSHSHSPRVLQVTFDFQYNISL